MQDASAYSLPLSGGPADFGADLDGGFALFNGLPAASGGAYISSAHAAEASTAERLVIEARLRRSSDAFVWQTLASVPNSWLVRMRGDALQALFVDRDGRLSKLAISHLGVSDGVWRDLKIVYDGAEATISAFVDGELKGSIIVPGGPIARQPTQSLYIGGTPWGATFAADVRRFMLSR